MKPITRRELNTTNVYVAYLSTRSRSRCRDRPIRFCYQPENPDCYDSLRDVNDEIYTPYSFGSAWELYELTEDEVCSHIIMEAL